MTHKGYREITNIYPNEKKPVYRIKLKSGKYIDCSINHQFPTKHKKLKSIESGLKVGDKLFIKKY